ERAEVGHAQHPLATYERCGHRRMDDVALAGGLIEYVVFVAVEYATAQDQRLGSCTADDRDLPVSACVVELVVLLLLLREDSQGLDRSQLRESLDGVVRYFPTDGEFVSRPRVAFGCLGWLARFVIPRGAGFDAPPVRAGALAAVLEPEGLIRRD